jgi:hypothetical protein
MVQKLIEIFFLGLGTIGRLIVRVKHPEHEASYNKNV